MKGALEQYEDQCTVYGLDGRTLRACDRCRDLSGTDLKAKSGRIEQKLCLSLFVALPRHLARRSQTVYTLILA